MGDTPIIYTLVPSSCPSLVDYATPTRSNITRFNALKRLMPAVGAPKSLRLFTDERWAGKGYDTSLMSTEVHTRLFHRHEQGVWRLKPKVFNIAPQKLAGSWTGREGKTTPTHEQPSASGTPILCWPLEAHRKPTGSPQPIPKLTQSFLMGTLHSHSIRSLYNTAHDFISRMDGATNPPHNNTHFTCSLLSSRQCYQQTLTMVVCRIN